MPRIVRFARRLCLPILFAGSVLAIPVGAAASPSQDNTPARPPAASPFFSPTSFWNRPTAGNARLASGSSRMVSNLLRYVTAESRAKNGPWINASHDGVAIVTVPGNQRTVRVRLANHSPDGALTSAWSTVPLPASARPSSGDNDLAVWQPSTDRMWEFYELSRQANGWQAEWGGAIQNVSSNPGAYGPGAWPGAKTYWGVTAASLPIVGGAITFGDLAAGQIDHALALIVPDVRADTFASPAERDDGTSHGPGSVPEGAQLRLNPKLNLAKLDMPPLTRMIAVAAQRYGIIIRDHSPIVAFIGQDPVGSAAGTRLYTKLYGGLDAWQLMASFPWSHLQVLRMHLHRGS